MRVSLSDAEKTIDFVLQWFDDAQTALRERLNEEQASKVHHSRNIFLGMTKDEVDTFFRELEYLAILDLLAATEAAMKVDFWTRVQAKHKDPLSRQFRQLAKQQKRKISLADHVLAAWVSHHPELKTRADDFRRVLKLRHWLAHGRYWTPKFNALNYSPADTFDICDRLLQKASLGKQM